MENNSSQKVEASFSTLTMSIASSAAMALGLAPDPQSGKVELQPELATFNIDLLSMLQEKTKNNLSKEESNFLSSVLSDLKMRFVQMSAQKEK